MGAAGSCFDNAMMESFWGRMQVELFNRHRWKTRIALASAIHDYIELWHNTRRRHSSLDMLTPAEIEANWHNTRARHLLAKTAPNATVDDTPAAGLSADQVDINPPHEQLHDHDKAA